jgi:hypothetical protein
VRKWFVLSLVTVGALVGAAVALAAPTTTLEVKAIPAKASTKKKVRPIQLAINTTYADAAAADQTPPPLRKVVIRFNKGGAFNGKFFAKCKRSVLETKGPSACKKARVGTGKTTASAKPFLPLVHANTTIYNGPGNTILLYNAAVEVNVVVIVEGTVKKAAPTSCADGAGQCDYTLTFNIPPIPTLGSAPDVSVLSVNTKTLKVFVTKRKRGKKVKIPYIGAPKECKGKWVADEQVTFADGSTATATTSAPCHK